MWKRGEIAPQEQFLLFSTLFYIYIFQFIVFLTLSTPMCRSTDISKCFSESFGIRDNGSRLYFLNISFMEAVLSKVQSNLNNSKVQSNLNNSNPDGPFTMALSNLFFQSLRSSSDSSRKQIFQEIFLFYDEIVC